MQYNPVGWFEIPVLDMERATKFYEVLLDLKLDQHEMGDMLMAWFPMKEGVLGSTGSLVKHNMYKPSTDGVVIYFTSPSGDVANELSKVEKLGGKILIDKKDIGEYGYIGVFMDTEGNKVALHARK